ncbi:tRNA guanosine(34) transglycosylase Tgt [bacterium]|nr:tRNA guanosine(34) transglycosylase Tgt [bacterium]
MSAIGFELIATDWAGQARAGLLHTPHGTVETPIFMPVGTRASVKGLTPEQLRQASASMILGNTYHLALRPGSAIVAEMGGLHRFMGWNGPILTDSGGFQVFSLESLRQLDDDGVEFKSHLDGATLRLTPERATQIQEELGADIVMCFDECPPAGCPADQLERAVARTTTWARRCKEAHSRSDQGLFGIVQGGLDPAQRARSARELVELDFPGYAIGGLSVGESADQMHQMVEVTAPMLPTDKPRYLMGVGRPEDLLEGVARGIDMFDCVMPTRNGRNALAFTSRGKVRLRNSQHERDPAPLDPACLCPTCTQFSRAYLRHLFQVEEMLGPILVSLHNVAFYQRTMREARQAIQEGAFDAYRSRALAEWGQSP